jgi:hypothetical protein
VGITPPRTFKCNAKDKAQLFIKGVVMHTTKRGLNRLIKKIMEVDGLISRSATVGGIILSAKFAYKRATIDSMGNIIINVSMSQCENPRVDLETAAQWVNRPITIAMECGQCKDVLPPIIVPLYY